MHRPCRTRMSGDGSHGFDDSLVGGCPVAAAALRYAGGLLGRAAVVLGEDDLHRPLEGRARRPGAGGDPIVEVLFRHLEEGGEPVAAALQELALLEDSGAHLCPAGMMDHCHGAVTSKCRSLT